MNKVVIPGFVQSPFSNRFISASAQINESIDLPDGNGQIFMLSFKPGTIRPTHTHEEIRLTFVRSGRMRIELADSAFEMGPGDFFSSFPNTPHSLEVLGEETLNIIEMVMPSGNDIQHCHEEETK